jgi:epoxyqueuosine reductase
MSFSVLDINGLNETLRDAASNEGMHFFGVASLDVRDDYQRYADWLSESRHGSMTWMSNHLEIRSNPSLLLPGAKSALIFGFSYSLGDHWLRGETSARPKIAQYARMADYHKFIRAKLARIQKVLTTLSGIDHQWRITVDSAPLLERALAANTGGGFIGKNTCIIHPTKGSFFLLGEILTTWDIAVHPGALNPSRHRERDKAGGCGTCKRCQVHCPTGALDEDYRIDARKCLSYWTIEHRGEIPIEYWPWIGRYVFGCDICQLVCPYNRGIAPSEEARRLERLKEAPDLMAMITMDQAFYEKVFGGTPLTRAKRSGLRRNALIAATVKGDARIPQLLKILLDDGDGVIKRTALTAQTYLEKSKKD